MTVSLRDILLAVGYGDASLVGETSGYLILGAADCAISRTESATADSITLTEDGSVRLEGARADEDQVERALRALLGQLLRRVRIPSPNLQRVAERGDVRGLRGLVSELEAALVPVNRRAARRTLARLCRESLKSAARARVHVAVEEVMPVYEEPAQEPPSPETPQPVLAVASPGQLPLAPSPPAPSVHPVVLAERAEQVVTRVQRISQLPTVPAKNVISSLAAVVGEYGAQTPVELGPDCFEYHIDCEFDEDQHYSEPDGFGSDDDLDEEPTRVFAGVAPRGPAELGQVAFELSPAPVRVRRRAYVPPQREKTWSDDESLISLSNRTPQRRPSDISELLDHMTVSQLETSEVYAGLKSLSRVDLSPIAPPVSGAYFDEDPLK
jgi:hypothetical protein